MRTTSVTQSLIDNQQMQIYSLKSQLTKANELIDLLNEEALSRIGVITHLETKLGKAEELIGKLEASLKFYGDENKWFIRSKIIDPTKDLIFASRYNDEKGESEPVELKELFESKSFECTARLKVDQGKRANEALEEIAKWRGNEGRWAG